MTSLSAFFYLILAIIQGVFNHFRVTRSIGGYTIWVGVVGIALLAHGVVISTWMDADPQSPRTLFQLLSVAAWFCYFSLLPLCNYQVIRQVSVGLSCMLSVTLWCYLLYPGAYIELYVSNHQYMIHVLAALSAVCVMFIAGFQSLMLFAQYQLLRRNPASPFFQYMPALEKMERLLFFSVMASFILLTAVILFGVFDSSVDFRISYKYGLASLAWLIFAGLVASKYITGWRSQVAVLWSLLGIGTIFVLLILFSLIGGN